MVQPWGRKSHAVFVLGAGMPGVSGEVNASGPPMSGASANEPGVVASLVPGLAAPRVGAVKRSGGRRAPGSGQRSASRCGPTHPGRPGLKDYGRDLRGVELSKEQQSSDWGAETLPPEQIRYAAADVLHLHALREKLDIMLAREGRADLAGACFGFLGHRVELDLRGWADADIFAY